jgi:hypothetical protein
MQLLLLFCAFEAAHPEVKSFHRATSHTHHVLHCDGE